MHNQAFNSDSLQRGICYANFTPRCKPLRRQAGSALPVNLALGIQDRKKIMTGKFLKRGAIIDTKKSEERMNAVQKRAGSQRYHVRVTSCGCPDPNCGAFHVLETDRPLPSATEAMASLRRTSKQRKLAEQSGRAQQAASRDRSKTRSA